MKIRLHVLLRATAIHAVAWFLVAAVTPAIGADAETIKAKSQVCEACHGPSGNSTDPIVPSLAAQPKQFITTQLVMYREGQRKNVLMSAIANGMTNPEINDYGTFFAAKKLQVTAPAMPADKSALGRRMVEQFNCTQCHGPTLMGQQHIPRIAGQQVEYLRVQLRGFKAATRFDMDGNMTAAAQALTPSDIDTLSDYLASLQ